LPPKLVSIFDNFQPNFDPSVTELSDPNNLRSLMERLASNLGLEQVTSFNDNEYNNNNNNNSNRDQIGTQ